MNLLMLYIMQNRREANEKIMNMYQRRGHSKLQKAVMSTSQAYSEDDEVDESDSEDDDEGNEDDQKQWMKTLVAPTTLPQK